MTPRTKYGAQTFMITQAGYLARSVDDVVLGMRAQLTPAVFAADPAVPPVPFRDEVFKARTPLRLGFCATFPFMEPAPACQRAVREAADLLRGERGVELVPWEWPAALVNRLVLNFYAIMAAEGDMRGFLDALDGERMAAEYKFLYVIARVPRWLRPALAGALRLLGNQRTAAMVGIAYKRTCGEYWDLVKETNDLVREFVDAWNASGLDALLCPAVATAALRHGESRFLTPACTTTFLFNVLGFPGGTVPVTFVRPDEEAYDPGEHGWDLLSKHAAASGVGSAGLPVGCQVVAKNFEDEVVLRVMKLLQAKLGHAGGALPLPGGRAGGPAPFSPEK